MMTPEPRPKRLIPLDYQDNDGVRTAVDTADPYGPTYDQFMAVIDDCGILPSSEQAAYSLALSTYLRWDRDGRPVLEDPELYELYWDTADAHAVERDPAPADAIERRKANPDRPVDSSAAIAALVPLMKAGRYYSKGRQHDKLAFALATSERLSATSDAVLLNAVIEARKAGRTWDYIGDALGLARQNVFRRFAHRIPD